MIVGWGYVQESNEIVHTRLVIPLGCSAETSTAPLVVLVNPPSSANSGKNVFGRDKRCSWEVEGGHQYRQT